MARRRRPTYSPEFRAEAVRRVRNSDEPLQAIAARSRIAPITLRTWMEASRPKPESPLTEDERTELQRLRKEVRELRDGARDLKKSDGLLRQAQRVRFAFIAAEKAHYPVRILCRCLASGAVASMRGRSDGPSPRSAQDVRLMHRLRLVHALHRRVYGRPRLQRALRDAGIRISEKRVRAADAGGRPRRAGDAAPFA